MNGILAIAEGFLELMTNPRHGADVNEAYSLRFHQLLAEDPRFTDTFAGLDLGPDDVTSLPSCAWPWYLQWRTGHGDPPSADFLDALYDSTDDPAIRMAVMQTAMSAPDSEDREAGPRPAPPAGTTVPAPRDQQEPHAAERADQPIPSRWLRARVSDLTRTANQDPAGRAAMAAELASYLLQLGDPASLDALARLLAMSWPGQSDLADTVRRRLARAGLDPVTEADWTLRLGLAAPPGPDYRDIS